MAAVTSVTKRIAIAGAGITGAVVARQLAEAGYAVDVFEERPHVAGNCHTARDPDTGVMVHVYGPHIFHTDSERVWAYVNAYGEFELYVNRVKAQTAGRVFTLPINLLTINQFFGRTLSPRAAVEFIGSLCDRSIGEPRNFEEQALKFVGRDLYEAFFEGYTFKQWGRDPRELPASILKRLPVRFNYDDNYYAHRFQGMPRHGYTDLVARILAHPSIIVFLDTRLAPAAAAERYDHLFWSGPLDAFFDYSLGRLAYRTLDFEPVRADGDFQGCAVMNYCDRSVPFTRIAEHKHFSPWERHERTICFREYSRSCEPGDVPFYPVRLAREELLLERYAALARTATRVSFIGRLGTFRYLDMDVSIGEALSAAERFVECERAGLPVPAFFSDPLAH